MSENGWIKMSKFVDEKWTVRYGSLGNISVDNIYISQNNNKRVPANISYKSRREAIEGLAKRLNELLKEE